MFVVRRTFGELTRERDQLRSVTAAQRIDDTGDIRRGDRPEHGGDFRLAQFSAAIGNRLVEQAQRIPDTPVRGLREQRERSVVGGDGFRVRDRPQVRAELLDADPLQVELQTARQDRDRELLRVGRGEQKFDMRRRFFEGFQQRIERMRRKHVYFVDQVDLVTPTGWRVLHVVEQIPGFVDFRARSGVDFDQVHEPALVDLDTARTLTTRRTAHALLTIQSLREYARERSLADPARAGKQVRVMQSIGIKRVDECPEHMPLADDTIESPGTPLAGQNLIAHRILNGCGNNALHRRVRSHRTRI